MPKPNQLGKPSFEGLDPIFAQHYSQMIDTVNTLAGYNGEVELSNHLNMGGNNVKGLGAPTSPTDALASGVAARAYSPSVIAQALKPGMPNSIVGYRQINSKTQREQQSSWLNDLMSTPPSANNIFPIIGPSMGGVLVGIPASPFTFSDGTTVNLLAYTHLLSLPTSFTIVSISSSGTTVTAVLSSAPPYAAGSVINVDGVTPSSFDGTNIVLTSVAGATITWTASLGTLTGSGGTVSAAGVYYFLASKRSNVITLLGPFGADTAHNRLQANFDGFQIIAVVVVTASGGQVELSGGGGSPISGSPTAGTFF